MRQPKHAKSPGDFSVCSAGAAQTAIETRRWDGTRGRDVEKSALLSRTERDSEIKCRSNDTIENRSGCIRNVWLFFIQNRKRRSTAPDPYLRVSTADREMSAAAFRPKKAQRAFFACFGWPNTVRAMPFSLNIRFRLKERAVVYAIRPGTLSGGERPECPSRVPRAQRI